MNKDEPTSDIVEYLRNRVGQETRSVDVVGSEPWVPILASDLLIIADRLELGEASAEVLFTLRESLKAATDFGPGPEYEARKARYLAAVNVSDALWTAAIGIERRSIDTAKMERAAALDAEMERTRDGQARYKRLEAQLGADDPDADDPSYDDDGEVQR